MKKHKEVRREPVVMETKEMYGYYVPSEMEQEEILNERKGLFHIRAIPLSFICFLISWHFIVIHSFNKKKKSISK